MYVDMMNGHIVLLRKYVIYQREIDVVARNMCYVILRILLTMFFSCVLLLDLYEELFFFTFDIYPLVNVTNMFGSNWLNGVYKSTKAKICVGVCALVWVIWNCENNLVSNNIGTARLLQVIFF
jgi:hypothetical protein